ncbi:bifunctional oligoribonuclease/PAP phosphatase NrnA [Haloimpatiens sp. FM7330]|uniref:DHH family phosphoesterase n=1 Tax=Haloimpatiens sp. FM7330 TaxID=3298610 RepID=UPI00362FE7BB
MIMNDIINKIKESSTIAVTFHESPDGDSVGTSLALMQGLRKLNKEVYIVSKDKIPTNLSFLPFAKEIDGISDEILEETDCVIVVDCGDVKRINVKDLDITNRNFTLINIDHHRTNEMYGDYNYVDTNAIAVAEVIYQILRMMNISIDKEMAACLYTSLITDSGSFRHSGTTCVTHTIAGDLINTGIDFSDIHRKVFENKSYNKVKFSGRVIENMELACNEKICVMKITKDMLEEFDIDSSNTGDIVSLGTVIDTVEVTILLKEAEEGTKISLRSKAQVDVRKVAECFQGGGHTRAAGMFLNKEIDEAKDIIVKEVEKELI